MRRNLIVALMLVAVTAGTVEAKVQTKLIDYKQGDTVLQGFMAWNDAQQGLRPGVLIGHSNHTGHYEATLEFAWQSGFPLCGAPDRSTSRTR